MLPPTLIYDQLCAQWPEIWEQVAVDQQIDPADPLATGRTDALAGDE